MCYRTSEQNVSKKNAKVLYDWWKRVNICSKTKILKRKEEKKKNIQKTLRSKQDDKETRRIFKS